MATRYRTAGPRQRITGCAREEGTNYAEKKARGFVILIFMTHSWRREPQNSTKVSLFCARPLLTPAAPTADLDLSEGGTVGWVSSERTNFPGFPAVLIERKRRR